MAKCHKCGEKFIGYMQYHCPKCKRELAGFKPRKSKSLCYDCGENWYNQNKKGGCWSYKSAKVVIKDVYHSLNQVIPNPTWKLSCFHKKY